MTNKTYRFFLYVIDYNQIYMEKIKKVLTQNQLLTFVGFINEALILSCVFVFLYSTILDFLNKHFHASQPVGFIREGAAPEPFEILLYLALVGSGVFITYLIHAYTSYDKKHTSGYIIGLKYISLVFFSLLFKTYLGTFPMSHDIYPYSKALHTPLSLLIFFAYCGLCLFFIVEISFLSRLIKKHFVRSIVISSLVIFIIAVFTFEPQFPAVGHDYSYFLGPVWEIIHGKTIYTDVSSQYGFLSVLFLSLLYKLQLIDVFYLPAFVWILYIVQYFICFYLIRKLTGNIVISLIGLFSIMSVNYFSLFHSPASILQIGPLRWLPLLIPIYILVRGNTSLISNIFIAIISLSSFWILDSGIALLMSFCFTIFILFLKKDINLKNAVGVYIKLALGLISVYMMINFIHGILGYKLINILTVFSKLQQYAKAGFGMILMYPIYSHFWLTIFVFFLTIVYFFRKKDLVHKDRVILFTACISIFASVYFVGRSHPHNIFHISLFVLLAMFFLTGLLGISSYKNAYARLLVYTMLFIGFIVYPIFNRHEVMAIIIKEKIENLQARTIFTPMWISKLDEKYSEEVDMIKSQVLDDKIVILSADDTYLHYLTGKQNLLYDNSQFTILTQDDIDNSMRDVYKICPQKIVGDCTLFGKCLKSNTFTETFFNIQPILLDSIQQKCQTKYVPLMCTKHLCIAQKSD